jgi:hypothetical protein
LHQIVKLETEANSGKFDVTLLNVTEFDDDDDDGHVDGMRLGLRTAATNRPIHPPGYI